MLKFLFFQVILGKNDLRYYEPESKVVRIHKVIMHPGYDSESLKNDIALLKIDRVQFTKYIQPICLPGFNSLYAFIKATGKIF